MHAQLCWTWFDCCRDSHRFQVLLMRKTIRTVNVCYMNLTWKQSPLQRANEIYWISFLFQLSWWIALNSKPHWLVGSRQTLIRLLWQVYIALQRHNHPCLFKVASVHYTFISLPSIFSTVDGMSALFEHPMLNTFPSFSYVLLTDTLKPLLERNRIKLCNCCGASEGPTFQRQATQVMVFFSAFNRVLLYLICYLEYAA